MDSTLECVLTGYLSYSGRSEKKKIIRRTVERKAANIVRCTVICNVYFAKRISAF